MSFGRVMSSLIPEEGQQLTEFEKSLITRLLPLIVATIDDRSWRVRWTAAAKFADVIFAYDKLPNVMDALIPSYEKLLQDPEAEVRTAATFNLAKVACSCTAQVPTPPIGRPPTEAEMMDYHGPRMSAAERLVKRVTSLTEDDSEHVRAALAMVATELAPILGKDSTITHLVPPVLLLLRDAASEVRLNLISSLGALNEVIGIDLLSQSLLPAILDLAQDGKWRIRLAILEHIPKLAKQLGKDFFTDKLASICVGWLGDDIATIRSAAATNLKDLTGIFGTEWACEYLIPSIEDIRHHPSYLRRLTAVQTCSQMALEMDPGIASTEVVPILLEMATDVVSQQFSLVLRCYCCCLFQGLTFFLLHLQVPNIRFKVAKSLAEVAPVCGKQVYEQQIKPVLSMLEDDSDRDVRFYAEHSARSLEEKFA